MCRSPQRELDALTTKSYSSPSLLERSVKCFIHIQERTITNGTSRTKGPRTLEQDQLCRKGSVVRPALASGQGTAVWQLQNQDRRPCVLRQSKTGTTDGSILSGTISPRRLRTRVGRHRGLHADDHREEAQYGQGRTIL